MVSVPRALPRLVRLPSTGTADFIFLADLVAHHAVRMYHGYDIVSSAPFRVTRNSNLYLAEEEARSLLESVRAELHNRRKGDAVRMEIEADADPEIIDRLRTVFELDPWQVFPVNGPVNLSRLFNVYEQTKHPELKFGLTHEFLDRRDGWRPLAAEYQLNPRSVVGIDHALGYAALKSREIDVKDAYSTDAKIAEYDLVALEDDRRFFPQYKAIFLFRLALENRAIDALRKLEGTIDEQKMIRLNAEAELR